MYKKIQEIIISILIILSISLSSIAQNIEIPSAKVCVNGLLTHDYSLLVHKKHKSYLLKLRLPCYQLSTKIPEEEYRQIDSLIIRVNSVAPKRNIRVVSCVKYTQRLNVSTCIVCDDSGKKYSEIEIWHPVGFR